MVSVKALVILVTLDLIVPLVRSESDVKVIRRDIGNSRLLETVAGCDGNWHRDTCTSTGQGVAQVTRKRQLADVTCVDVFRQADDCRTEVLEDCFDLGTFNWYGGSVIRRMEWPVEKWNHPSVPYVVGEPLGTPAGYGNVQERYWINSNGTGIYVDWETPLWLSINAKSEQRICFKAQYTNSPYNNYDDTMVFLNYTVCQGDNVRTIHDYMSAQHIARPTDIPDERVFHSPIWSTWAQFLRGVTQADVLQYAQSIVDNGFTNSQMEIDDRWERYYGDMDFNSDKFPDPSGMVKQLSDMGFRTTLWVHPFVNLDSAVLNAGFNRVAYVTDPSSTMPALTNWWNGASAFIIDFTADRSAIWFKNRLKDLQNNYNISTFKFDAGETNYLPKCFFLSERGFRNPCRYTTRYVEMAASTEATARNQEVRSSALNQQLPIFTRMMDKDSLWGRNNGLTTLIPHALTFGIIGYPFVLPDMVGGNAYATELPDRELFIRWIELNALLPTIQFSIAPWQYDSEVVSICKKMMDIHELYAPRIIDLAREATLTGAPIVRPLWWIAPTDPNALSIDQEFLLGDDILVAPVVIQGDTHVDVYFPAGTWRSELRGEVFTGGQWVYGYAVALDELAYFTRIE